MLFGKNDVVPSRVFVEDAYTTDEKLSNKIEIPAIMGSPKPTTFQHYLKQDESKIRPEYNLNGLSGYRGLNDYNQNTVINGNKLYWHQGTIDYPVYIEIKTKTFTEFLNANNLENVFSNFLFNQDRTVFNFSELTQEQYKAIIKYNLTNKESQHTAIRPILSNAIFEGCIRFENLTKSELGALLFTLCLPDNLCLKIGMGKALGFGSIKIKSKVKISNRNLRYKDLLSDWSGNNDENSYLTKTEVDALISIFEKYVLLEIGSSSSSLWQEKRMAELKTMLDFNNQISGLKAKYMVIRNEAHQNEYKSRPILQSPINYMKKT
jgi:CRISPR-associated protein (TIGR03986 family)